MKNIFFIILLAVFVSCDSVDSAKKKNNTKNVKTDVELSDLLENEVKLEDYKGKKILVNYWATWCGPCKKEMPDLLNAQEILTKENYVFLLVSDESIAKINKFKSSSKYKFNFLISKKSMSSIGVYALPTTFIYNEKGEKVEEIVGAKKWDSEAMITKLKNIK